MTTARERILDAAEDLIVAGHVPPSLESVASAAGVSKGGLLYHFDKHSLLHGLVMRAVQMTDRRLVAAAEQRRMASAWLRLSVPDAGERRLFQAMHSLLRLTSGGEIELPEEVHQAVARWDRMLAEELGEPGRARVVRLVGDGLFLGAITGAPATPAEVQALIEHLGLPADAPS